jgi:hypothetical protein
MRSAGLLSAIVLPLATAVLGACGDPLSLNPATIANQVDTVTVWAANGTPVYLPSAYDIYLRARERLDQVSGFDFLYAISPAGKHVFLPLAAVAPTGRTTGNPGFQATETPFDSITVAQQLGYVTTDTVPATLGQVYYARSALNTTACPLGIPFYAKMQVLSFDDSVRSVTFRILSNVNCGYRALEVGLPKK